VTIGRLLSDYSEFWAFLTITNYGDGSKRLAGRFSLQLTSGGLQGSLMDPTSNQYCSLIQTSLDDLLLAFEVGLRDNSLSWRPSNYGKTKK
jgi:hypothetical protein